MARKDHWYWIAYTNKIEKVKLVRRGTGGRKLHQDIDDPMVVVSEEGDEFVMASADLHDNPVQAHVASIALARENGLEPVLSPNPVEDETEEGEEYEDEGDAEEDDAEYEDEGDYEEEDEDEYEEGEEPEED